MSISMSSMGMESGSSHVMEVKTLKPNNVGSLYSLLPGQDNCFPVLMNQQKDSHRKDLMLGVVANAKALLWATIVASHVQFGMAWLT